VLFLEPNASKHCNNLESGHAGHYTIQARKILPKPKIDLLQHPQRVPRSSTTATYLFLSRTGLFLVNMKGGVKMESPA
jgi:hypothetical protein